PSSKILDTCIIHYFYNFKVFRPFSFDFVYPPNNFNPTAPDMIQAKNNNRFHLAPSLKKRIPINTAPAAPNPVQTAYALPIGILRIANDQKMRSNVYVRTSSARRLSYFFCKYKLIQRTPTISPTLAMNKYTHAHLVHLDFFICR